MDKSPDAFRTISEVAGVLETPAHVLRFWESRFPQIKPVKRAGGRRYYRPSDVALLVGIKRLLHDEGLTIRGVQKILRDHGVRHVAGLSDESVTIGDLVAAPDLQEAELTGVTDLAAALAEAEVKPVEDHQDIPEAGFVAIEDEGQQPTPEHGAPKQQVLPLFDIPAQSAAAAPVAAPRSAPRQPTWRDDISYSSLIRALPAKALTPSAPEIAALARRLATLRAQMANRAEGGQG
jgi:DNA-binding transcriptional MerR regulator